MEIPHPLIGHLSELTVALEEPGADLQAMLAVLLDDLMTAVPSFLGLTMTIPSATDGRDGVTLNLLSPSSVDAVSTSLLLPLDALGVSDSSGTVVFYAAAAGAFADLASDTRLALNLDGQVALDQHLPSIDQQPSASGVSGHTAASAVNRAIGILLDRGHTVDRASSILRQRADQDGVALHHAAQQVLDTPADGRPPTG